MFLIEKIDDRISLGSLDLQAFQLQRGPSTKREIERDGIEFLLKKMFSDKRPVLEYTPARKPFLSSHKTHISISHSHDMLMIISNSSEETGLDVELLRDKVRNIKHKFLNTKELNFAGDDAQKLVTLWAAKEAMYKAYGNKEVDFIGDLFVDDFTEAHTEFSGHIRCKGFEKSYLMRKETRGNYIVVYILREILPIHN